MENKVDEKETLFAIQKAIENAREQIHTDGFFFLLWGWLVLAASLINYGLLKFTTFEYPIISWPVLMTAGSITVAIVGRKRVKENKIITYFDSVLKYVWLGFFISLVIVLVMPSFGFFSKNVGYPFIIILLGWGTIISGGILKFKPLIIGGILAWVIAIADFFVSVENQLLMMALATIIAYLIPGYMLKSKAPDDLSSPD